MTSSTGPTRILLVRHGQSEWNLSGRWQGQADPPLTDLGRSQARAAARSLGTVDAIWSSDLQRAAETATILAGELGVGPVVVDPDLRERDAGEWSGLTRVEIDERYPGYLEPLVGEDPEGWKPRRPPGWESDAALATRVHRVLLTMRREVGAGDILAVVHAGLLYTVERELGSDGSRLGNLEGRWVELLPAADELHLGDHVDGVEVRLADIAKAGDRVSLLAPEDVTVPDQI
jgi:broad specificity phosphatase PhoE